jgi:hypothetical protein
MGGRFTPNSSGMSDCRFGDFGLNGRHRPVNIGSYLLAVHSVVATVPSGESVSVSIQNILTTSGHQHFQPPPWALNGFLSVLTGPPSLNSFWKLVRNANSWPLPGPSESETLNNLL